MLNTVGILLGAHTMAAIATMTLVHHQFSFVYDP